MHPGIMISTERKGESREDARNFRMLSLENIAYKLRAFRCRASPMAGASIGLIFLFIRHPRTLTLGN
ncbi:hypothetical protein CDV31_003487 [Fusarium ambrosium]|uniref:Uncharacterized protein n=1 Tax=Fusarium ambrosium TaxID=131363 RepID=A0A428UTY8_9HYPO|nr:hypothetical protein CDV31_003487 [Fusarium ambrosium]